MLQIKYYSIRIWGVYEDKLYDLTDYVFSMNLFSNTPTYNFLDPDLVAIFKQRSGQDITQPMNQVLATMDPSTRAAHTACLENVFLAGAPDFRKTPRCQVQNYLLIIASGVLMASIAVKCKC